MHGPGGHAHTHAEHGHSHGGAGHAHIVSAVGVAEPKWLWIALGLNVAVAVLQVVIGIIAGSTALLADSAHVLTDAIAIGIALASVRIAQRPATDRYTFGFGRVEIVGAQINGASLLVLAGMLAVGAVVRLLDPPTVDGGLVAITGVFGLLANVLAAWALLRANRQSLAVEGAYQHALMDAISSFAAIIAGLLVIAGVGNGVDPLLALAVTALMVRSGWSLLSASTKVLLEGAPVGTPAREVGEALAQVDGVREVHDLHVWELTQGFPSVTAHVVIEPGLAPHELRFALERVLRERFGVSHSTLQVDVDRRDELVQLGAGGSSIPLGPA